MGSLRNKMISETLNYERSMNRIILDRTIEQAKLFNESRSPPSNRDVKFEALIGDLVNKLKQKIQETTSMIAETQYDDVGTKEFLSAMKKKTGEHPHNGAIETNAEFDDLSDVSREEDARTESVYSDDFEDQDDADSEERQLHQVGKGFTGRMIGMGKARREKMKGKKDPLKTMKRRKEGGANSEGEGDSPLPAGEGREKEEKQMSAEQQIKQVENGVLSVVSEYNGIVSKILEATQPQGRFASKSTTTQTNIQFLGGLLRDLAQPLKQLEFELSSSKFPELTKYFNLINNMVKIVESSPPFQKINSDAYKNAPIDFQGANDAMVLDEPAYKSELTLYFRRLLNASRKLQGQYGAFRFNMQALARTDPALADEGLARINDKIGHINNILDKVKEEIELIGTREITKENKANVLRELKYRTEEAETALLDSIVEGHSQARADAIRRAPTMPAPERLPTAAARVFGDLGVAAPQYADYNDDPEFAGLMAELDALNIEGEAQMDEEEFQRLMAELDIQNRADEGLEDAPQAGDLVAYAPRGAPRAPRAPRAAAPQLGFDAPPAAAPQLGFDAPLALEYDEFATMNFLQLKAAARARGISLAYGQSGGVKSKEDLLRELRALTGQGRKGKKSKKDKEEKEEKKSKRKSKKDKEGGNQEGHTRMGRAMTDEQKVRAIEVASNERWQRLSNPIHSTNVGLLYPFYEKDPASKYTFPMLLKHQRGKSAPTKNALGADYSLLQGQIGGPTVYPKDVKKPRTRKIVSQAEATQNIIEGKGRKKNKKSLHKLNFNDEKNEMFD